MRTVYVFHVAAGRDDQEPEPSNGRDDSTGVMPKRSAMIAAEPLEYHDLLRAVSHPTAGLLAAC